MAKHDRRELEQRQKRWIFLYLSATFLYGGVASLALFHRQESTGFIVGCITCLLLIASMNIMRFAQLLLQFRRKPPQVRLSLDLNSGIGPERATAIIVPCVIENLKKALSLCSKLRNLSAVVNDPDVYYVLLADMPDSKQQALSQSELSLLNQTRALVDKLNKDIEFQDKKPFFLLYRDRVFSHTQRAWIGWERKRGKVLQFAEYVAKGRSSFSVHEGELYRLRSVRYMMVLDEHTMLVRGTLQHLVGILSHPSNHPQLASDKRSVDSGYAILQPTIVLPRSCGKVACTTRATPAPRDVYDELLGQTWYLGRALIHVESFFSVIDAALPDEIILSHDAVESSLLPVGYAHGVFVLDRSPNRHDQRCRRYERWIRGDWQNLWWLFQPKSQCRVSIFGYVLVLMRVRQSLFRIAQVIVLLLGAAFNLSLLFTVLGMSLAPELLSVLIARRRSKRTDVLAVSLYRAIRIWMMWTCSSLHEAVLIVSAIMITAYRLIVGRKLLEWKATSLCKYENRFLTGCTIYRIASATSCAFAIYANERILHLHNPFTFTWLLAIWIAADCFGIYRNAMPKAVRGKENL